MLACLHARLRRCFLSRSLCTTLKRYCSGGELQEQLEAQPPLPCPPPFPERVARFTPDRARELTVEMLGALNYLHKNGVVHRDLKLENYIFTGPGKGEGQLKLIDFGLSRACIEGETMTTNVGSVIFKAPEVMAGAGYGTESDMWSLGVICHMLVTGLVPWEGDNRAEIEAAITKESSNPDGLMGLLMWFYESCKVPMDCQDFLLYVGRKSPLATKNLLVVTDGLRRPP